ncbi:MAG: T9SS type A sorting domain-containing protein [Bacteroidetes bacterium]|nr:T9SS type A sorting domain-containing protein [Bacteroidota bacterium]
MKKFKSFLIFVLISGLLMQFSASAQNLIDPAIEKMLQHYDQILKKNLADQQRDIISLPQEIHIYSWTDPNWIEEMYEEITYYPNGKENVVIDYDPSTGTESTRTTYSYDENWRITQMLIETWATGSWESMAKYTIAYDANGNQTEYLMYYWYGTSWMMAAGTKDTYAYTGQSYVQEVVHESYVFMYGWQYALKDIYTLNGSGSPTTILYQTYNSGWADSTRLVDISWYMYDPYSGYGSYNFYKMEGWSGSAWVPMLRETFTWDASGGYVAVLEEYIEGVWVYSIRTTMIMEGGMPQSYKTETWQGGLWVPTDGFLYLYTFNDIDLTQLIIQVLDPEALNYVNNTKYVYSNFLHITGVNDTPANKRITIYPNPVTDNLNFVIDKMNGIILSLEILNIAGQKVYSEEISNVPGSGSFTVNLTGIPKGVYFVRITGANESRISRFIIE